MQKEQRKLQFKSLLLIILPPAISLFLEIVAFFAGITISMINGTLSEESSYDNGPVFVIKFLLFIIVFGWWYYVMIPEGTGKESIVKENKNTVAVGAGSGNSTDGAAIKNLIVSALLVLSSALIGFINSRLYSDTADFSATTIISMIVLAPFAEEVLFRGLTMHYIEKAFNPVAAIIISSVFYGIYQFNLLQGIFAVLLGIILGCVRNKKDGLLIPILMHTAMNILFYLF